MNTNYKELINTASNIVVQVAQRNFSQLKNKNITQKKDGSFVTDFDTAIDRQLTQELTKIFPHINFISEESQDDVTQTEGLVWCIDPIDGTHNFMHDIPYYAVSVGLLNNGRPVAGIIYNPLEDTIISGGMDCDVLINNKPLRVSNNSRTVTSGCGHAYSSHQRELVIIDAMAQSEKFSYRRLGSLALDLMNLVRGRIGAIVSVHNSMWDWAAGMAIAQSIGYRVIDIEPEVFIISSEYLHEDISMIK